MLEDFIEVNELNAKLVNRAIVNSSSAKCELIMREPSILKPLLLVHLCSDNIDIEKLRRLFRNETLREPSAKETFHVTGYKKDYLPAISIYGVIVLIDEKAARKERLYILVDEERTLIIPPAEIAESNEECAVCDITG